MEATTATPESRTYEQFRIVWSDRSEWTGYDEAQAEATVAYAARNGGRTGFVVRSTFTVEVKPEFAHLYRPGIAEAAGR